MWWSRSPARAGGVAASPAHMALPKIVAAIAFVIVVFISFQAANRGVLIEMQGGATPLPAHVAILQALIGLPLTYGLGQLGLKVRALLQRGG